MINQELKDRIYREISGEILFGERLSNHSTMKVGGPAAVFVTPSNKEELIKTIQITTSVDVPFFVTGVGSNVLFRDGGFDGIVISTAKLTGFSVKKREEGALLIEAESGVLINDLVMHSIEEAVSGFEPLSGIPGTVGGALIMNAGTHDGSIADVLSTVTAIDRSGRVHDWQKDKIEFSYRKAKYPKSCIVLSAEFLLKKGERREIEGRVEALRERRRQRHPLKWPSLGSIFKNPPEGGSAGQLIEESGLKGVRVGGARISEQHGNWIVNEGTASAKDVEILIHLVKEKVKEAAGIPLETEIVIVGK